MYQTGGGWLLGARHLPQWVTENGKHTWTKQLIKSMSSVKFDGIDYKQKKLIKLCKEIILFRAGIEINES
jgi:hypothetical protein